MEHYEKYLVEVRAADLERLWSFLSDSEGLCAYEEKEKEEDRKKDSEKQIYEGKKVIKEVKGLRRTRVSKYS